MSGQRILEEKRKKRSTFVCPSWNSVRACCKIPGPYSLRHTAFKVRLLAAHVSLCASVRACVCVYSGPPATSCVSLFVFAAGDVDLPATPKLAKTALKNLLRENGSTVREGRLYKATINMKRGGKIMVCRYL